MPIPTNQRLKKITEMVQSIAIPPFQVSLVKSNSARSNLNVFCIHGSVIPSQMTPLLGRNVFFPFNNSVAFGIDEVVARRDPVKFSDSCACVL